LDGLFRNRGHYGGGGGRAALTSGASAAAAAAAAAAGAHQQIKGWRDGGERDFFSRVHVLDYLPVFGPRNDLHTRGRDCTHVCLSRELLAPHWVALAEILDDMSGLGE
jgi:hypothetical protein